LVALLMVAAFAHADTITLTGTGHDFKPIALGGTNPDFEAPIVDDRGIVMTTLGADGKPVYDTVAHPAGTATTHGQAFFDQWYHPTAGVTQEMPISITLTDIGGGVYQYSTGAFFPFDGRGWGDSLCCGHNYSFTFELHTAFTYQAGQIFSFAGDDDVFVFINKKLVIDLGGIHPTESASINLDTLGLTAGNDYTLDFFFAERHVTGSNFSMTTSIQSLKTVPEPGTLAMLGAGLLGIIRFRRRL
jgi:fibro-slime domain-containing protein